MRKLFVRIKVLFAYYRSVLKYFSFSARKRRSNRILMSIETMEDWKKEFKIDKENTAYFKKLNATTWVFGHPNVGEHRITKRFHDSVIPYIEFIEPKEIDMTTEEYRREIFHKNIMMPLFKDIAATKNKIEADTDIESVDADTSGFEHFKNGMLKMGKVEDLKRLKSILYLIHLSLEINRWDDIDHIFSNLYGEEK